jgi:hypothetical protein
MPTGRLLELADPCHLWSIGRPIQGSETIIHQLSRLGGCIIG